MADRLLPITISYQQMSLSTMRLKSSLVLMLSVGHFTGIIRNATWLTDLVTLMTSGSDVVSIDLIAVRRLGASGETAADDLAGPVGCI